MVGRVIFWALVVLTIGLVGWDGYRWVLSGSIMPTPLGQLWYTIDAGSLNLLQAVIERYVHPYVWNPIIFTVLLWPAWAVFGGLVVVVGTVRLALALLQRRGRWKQPVFRKRA